MMSSKILITVVVVFISVHTYSRVLHKNQQLEKTVDSILPPVNDEKSPGTAITSSAGPDHDCPNLKEEMGNSLLLKEALAKFPKQRVWFMHGGGSFVKECIEMMKICPGLYADVSVLNNPNIIPAKDFTTVIKEFIDAGLEDRLMFGSDNADIKKCINSVEQLTYLSVKQKEKIFHFNAETFFKK
jgi:uncharacterized protein